MAPAAVEADGLADPPVEVDFETADELVAVPAGGGREFAGSDGRLDDLGDADVGAGRVSSLTLIGILRSRFAVDDGRRVAILGEIQNNNLRFINR